MALEVENADVTPLWFRKYNAEGHAVISHPDYGDIPAWNEEIATALVALINYGTNASAEIIDHAVSTLIAKEST